MRHRAAAGHAARVGAMKRLVLGVLVLTLGTIAPVTAGLEYVVIRSFSAKSVRAPGYCLSTLDRICAPPHTKKIGQMFRAAS